ncbi:MAG: hypothetical protein II882_08830 [Lachnospiraceae bacterium]|nr:hypothetical protein [Lachnospiraceae bacterium]
MLEKHDIIRRVLYALLFIALLLQRRWIIYCVCILGIAVHIWLLRKKAVENRLLLWVPLVVFALVAVGTAVFAIINGGNAGA